MRLARDAGAVVIETAEGLLTSDGARQVARDLERLADAAERINREACAISAGQLTVDAETGEALPI